MTQGARADDIKIQFISVVITYGVFRVVGFLFRKPAPLGGSAKQYAVEKSSPSIKISVRAAWILENEPRACMVECFILEPPKPIKKSLIILLIIGA